MKKKYFLTIDDEFIQYCELNNIDDVEKFAYEAFKKGYAILKYGNRPPREVLLEELKRVKEQVKTDPILAKEFVDMTQKAVEGYRKDHESLYDE